MKIKIILLYLLLGFSIGLAQELSGGKNSLDKTAQEQNKVPEIVAVSDITERSSEMLKQIKAIETLTIETQEMLEMQAVLSSYCDSIDGLMKNENYSNLQLQNIRELQKMQSELSILNSLRSGENLQKVVSHSMMNKT